MKYIFSAVLVLLGALMQLAHAAKPAAFIPSSDGTVVERLPRGYMALQRVGTADVDPGTVDLLLATAGRTGDARLVARAETLIAQGRGITPDRAVVASAYAAQYRHDFRTARSRLAGRLASAPRDAQARLSLAYIDLVQGRIAAASASCDDLQAWARTGGDADAAMFCAAALDLRRGRLPDAASRVDAWLRTHETRDVAQRHALVLRAEVAARARDPGADVFFRRALAVDPGDVRTLAAWSRYLRETGRPAQALSLLTLAPDTDHVLLERSLAAQAAGDPRAMELARRMQFRLQATRALGGAVDLADEAAYQLAFGSPARALSLAIENFREQRDHEDLLLLRRAALRAGVPQAWDPIAAWARGAGVPSPGTRPAP